MGSEMRPLAQDLQYVLMFGKSQNSSQSIIKSFHNSLQSINDQDNCSLCLQVFVFIHSDQLQDFPRTWLFIISNDMVYHYVISEKLQKHPIANALICIVFLW